MLFGCFLSETSSGDSFSLKDRHYFLFLSLPPLPPITPPPAPWVFPPPALLMGLNAGLSPAPSCKGWGDSRGRAAGPGSGGRPDPEECEAWVHPPKLLRVATHSLGAPRLGTSSPGSGLIRPSGPGQAVAETGPRAHSREHLSDPGYSPARPLTSWWPWTSPSTSEPQLPPQKNGVIVPHPEGFLENHRRCS